MRRLFISAMASGLAVAGAAQAQDGLQEFVTICVETGARQEQVSERAASLGYRSFEERMPGFDLGMHSADGRRLVLLRLGETVFDVENGNRSSIRVRSNSCSLVDATVSHDRLTELATAWMGRSAPGPNRHGSLEWRFELDPARTPLPAGEDFDVSVFNRAPMAVLTVFPDREDSQPIINVDVLEPID